MLSANPCWVNIDLVNNDFRRCIHRLYICIAVTSYCIERCGKSWLFNLASLATEMLVIFRGVHTFPVILNTPTFLLVSLSLGHVAGANRVLPGATEL
jgi:hypothetical protein